VSVSWGDHLIFGEGDGRLDSPEALEHRMAYWREELRASKIHWRITRAHFKGRYHTARGYPRTIKNRVKSIQWKPLQVVPHLAHKFGMKAYLYVSLFDEGRPLPPKKVRMVSYHNAMHGQHISWQSHFSRRNPEFAVKDRTGQKCQWGVLCPAYPEVRVHFRRCFEQLLKGGDFDGLFVCLRSQSRPADFGDEFGFNEPVRREFLARYGRDICKQDFDLQCWRDLLGGYLTRFLSELRKTLRPKGLCLAVGVARGDVLGPPLGNTTLQWRDWVANGTVDDLIIDQDSSRCPSMWHDLWPMHRGYGYLQNYVDGYGMRPLLEDLEETYAPFFLPDKPAGLYVARQWDKRSQTEEQALLDHPAVRGLVFSSFRFDNPGPVAKGDWIA